MIRMRLDRDQGLLEFQVDGKPAFKLGGVDARARPFLNIAFEGDAASLLHGDQSDSVPASAQGERSGGSERLLCCWRTWRRCGSCRALTPRAGGLAGEFRGRGAGGGGADAGGAAAAARGGRRLLELKRSDDDDDREMMMTTMTMTMTSCDGVANTEHGWRTGHQDHTVTARSRQISAIWRGQDRGCPLVGRSVAERTRQPGQTAAGATAGTCARVGHVGQGAVLIREIGQTAADSVGTPQLLWERASRAREIRWTAAVWVGTTLPR
eukprot:707112-Rhodomonas_salina.1